MQFSTQISINSTPEHIWSLLIDLSAWSSWNATITSTEGSIEIGNKIKIEVTANPGKAFPVKVTELIEPRSLVFTGGMPLGLFKGVRTFTLTPKGSATEFAMSEVYSGPLARMITKSIPDLQPSFDDFAASLKQRAELSS
ncbi:MAG: SRPBCC domain-containing protein [Actinobacteria bacterium]|nr:SRPBCC domain-containing protein [Actinomycetota bacterium]